MIFRHVLLGWVPAGNRRELLRRCVFALQVATSFLFGTLLAYHSPRLSALALPYLVPLISTMLLQQSVGLTLLAGANYLIVLTPISIFLYLVQKGLTYHDYGPIAVLLFFTAWSARGIAAVPSAAAPLPTRVFVSL
jgi:hypothetical protein